MTGLGTVAVQELGCERCWFLGRKCTFPIIAQQQKQQVQFTKALWSCPSSSLAPFQDSLCPKMPAVSLSPELCGALFGMQGGGSFSVISRRTWSSFISICVIVKPPTIPRHFASLAQHLMVTAKLYCKVGFCHPKDKHKISCKLFLCPSWQVALCELLKSLGERTGEERLWKTAVPSITAGWAHYFSAFADIMQLYQSWWRCPPLPFSDTLQWRSSETCSKPTNASDACDSGV